MKPYTLTNREGESISPMTSTKTVFDEHGTDLDTLLIQQKQDGENALKDYAKKTEVTRDLSGKQDKLSTTTDLHITDDNILELTELAKTRLFDDMWRNAVGKSGGIDHGHYGEDGRHMPYYCNKIWLTYEDAVYIYQSYIRSTLFDANLYYRFEKPTQIPMRNKILGSIPSNYCFESKITHLKISEGNRMEVFANSLRNGLFNNGRITRAMLVEWLDTIILFGSDNNVYRVPIDALSNAPDLDIFDIRNVNANVDIRSSPKVKLSSLGNLVNYRFTGNNSVPFIVTVHPDIYAKLTGDTTNAAAAALTEEELAQWQQLLVDAADKQITFATT